MSSADRAVPATLRTMLASGLGAPIAASFAFGIGLSMALPLLALVLQARGVSGTMIGLNTAMAGVASLLATPIAVPVARRCGIVGGFVLSSIVLVISFLLFYVVEDVWLWFPLRLFFHGGLTVLFVLSEFWINAAVPNAQRGLAMGIYGSVMSIGFAAGPMILGAVGASGPEPFLIGAMLLLLAMVPVLLARAVQPRISGEAHASMFRFVLLAPIATAAAFFFGAVESGSVSFLPLYGLETGLGEAGAALLVTALGLGNVFSQIPLGLIADRFDRRLVLLVCGIVGTIGALMLPIAHGNLPAMLAVVFVWGGIASGLYTVGLTHLGARFTGIDLVSANSAFVLMYSFGALTGPAAMGFAGDAFPPHGIAWVTAALLGTFTVIAFVFRRSHGDA